MRVFNVVRWYSSKRPIKPVERISVLKCLHHAQHDVQVPSPFIYDVSEILITDLDREHGKIRTRDGLVCNCGCADTFLSTLMLMKPESF